MTEDARERAIKRAEYDVAFYRIKHEQMKAGEPEDSAEDIAHFCALQEVYCWPAMRERMSRRRKKAP